jgi:hypothetical protein
MLRNVNEADGMDVHLRRDGKREHIGPAKSDRRSLSGKPSAVNDFIGILLREARQNASEGATSVAWWPQLACALRSRAP